MEGENIGAPSITNVMPRGKLTDTKDISGKWE
jgi:hypothetical protein